MPVQQQSQTETLTADTVETFTFTGVTALSAVKIMSVTGSSAVFAAIGVNGATPATPDWEQGGGEGDDLLVIPAAAGAVYAQPYGFAEGHHSGNIVVKAISEGTPQITVTVD